MGYTYKEFWEHLTYMSYHHLDLPLVRRENWKPRKQYDIIPTPEESLKPENLL